jgi:hypothetical protein
VLLLAVAVVAVVVVARCTRWHGGVTGPGPSVGVSAGRLAATPVNGHVTGTAAASCGERSAADGRPLPDPACTPGVVSTAVTQNNLDAPFCRPGYTRTIRGLRV